MIRTIYENRVFDSKGVADPSVEIQFGPNIKDWPEMSALTENLLLKVVSEIHDPVTDHRRADPFRRDLFLPFQSSADWQSLPCPERILRYVGRAKEVQAAEKARMPRRASLPGASRRQAML